MMTAELGACEWFVWDLRRSNLVERGKLEQLVADYMARHPKAEPAELAAHLVDQTILTRFQADSLLNGKSQGLVLGSFIVHDILGSGTMGTVYKAKSKVNNEWYAVKVLPRRSMWNIRLARRKVRDFEQFNHQAVVPFVDVGTAGAMHYLAWPLVEGEPLNKLVERQGRLPAPEVALFGMLAAEGLEASHQRTILHGLLKPSNVMITPDQRVKILDFGVGSLLLESESGESVVDTMSSANTLASGLDCASPEGIMDPASMSYPSDQYSLGCILYFCLTGQYPFPGNNAVEKMMAHQTKQPRAIAELAPDCPEEVIEIIDRLMTKEPSERFGSMGEVASALRPHAMVVASMVQQAAPAARGKRAQGAGRQVAAAVPASYGEQESYNGAGYAVPPVSAQSGVRTGSSAQRQGNSGQYDRSAARPTPQPVSDSYGDTVAEVQGVPPSGFSSLRESLHQQDPRIQHQRSSQSGTSIGPMYGQYQQVSPSQGISPVTLVVAIVLSIVVAMAISMGLMIWLFKSGVLHMGQ
ncbi:MAG TPA: serine/threonine-protein kinase [Gemmatales bacterium]|nr:serine/threonine-protein kinase [Gemmatales bacterium]